MPDTRSSETDPAERPKTRWLAYTVRGLLALLLLLAVAGTYYAWWLHVDHRFREIDADRVYQSAAIPPRALERFVSEHHIKSVLDLRNDTSRDDDIAREHEELTRLGVHHAHLPMSPDPQLDEIDRAARFLLDEDNHPVLVHCHHGEGRSVMMAALYRVLSEQTDFDTAVWRTARLPEELMFLNWVVPASFAEDNFKVDRMRSYVEREGSR